MKSLFVTCEEVNARLSDALDGSLAPWPALKVRLHLLFCPCCRVILATLKALPRLVEDLEDRAPAAAEAALDGALASISRHGELRAWPATPVPAEARELLEDQPDLPMTILAAAHQTLARTRVPEPDPCHLPKGIRALLPPESQWRWVEGPKGKRRTLLLEDPLRGQRLILAFSPPGVRSKAHRHLGSESILVLSGAMCDKGLTLGAGDWIHHVKGSVHAPVILDTDCWCLIREEGATAAATTLERIRLVRTAS